MSLPFCFTEWAPALLWIRQPGNPRHGKLSVNPTSFVAKASLRNIAIRISGFTFSPTRWLRVLHGNVGASGCLVIHVKWGMNSPAHGGDVGHIDGLREHLDTIGVMNWPKVIWVIVKTWLPILTAAGSLGIVIFDRRVEVGRR